MASVVEELLKAEVAGSPDAAPRIWARIFPFGFLGAVILEYGNVRAQITFCNDSRPDALRPRGPVASAPPGSSRFKSSSATEGTERVDRVGGAA